jgi:hypothetical protein
MYSLSKEGAATIHFHYMFTSVTIGIGCPGSEFGWGTPFGSRASETHPSVPEWKVGGMVILIMGDPTSSGLLGNSNRELVNGSALDASGQNTYATGACTITVESTLNSMLDNYKNLY